MYQRNANPRLFSVLLSSRAKHERPDVPFALAIAGHIVVILGALWAGDPRLPDDAAPVDRVSFASADSVTNVLLIAQDVASDLFKTKMRAPTRQISNRIPDGALPAISDEGVGNTIALAVDSLKRTLMGFTWAMPGLPRRDSVTAAPDIDELSSSPRYTAHTRAPMLRNIDQVQRYLSRAFPRQLKRDGGNARTILWLLIDAGGGVRKALVRDSSGRADADSAALAATAVMQFAPAEQAGRRVPVWIQQPVRFVVQDVLVSH